jgi:hypothetical protein
VQQRIRETTEEKGTSLSTSVGSSSRAINVSHRMANEEGWRDMNKYSSDRRRETLAAWALPSTRRTSRGVHLSGRRADASVLLQESQKELAFQVISRIASPKPTVESGNVSRKASLVDPASVCLARLAPGDPRVRRAGCRSSECSSALLPPVCLHHVRLTEQRRHGGLFPPASQVGSAVIRSL